MIMITHSKVINETPEEYHLLLRNRGEDELFHYIHSNHIARAEPYVHDGYEYEIHSFPEQIIVSGKLRQLVYYVRGRKIGDEDGGSRPEIGCVIRFFRREDKKTDIVAELHHPAFEREFRSIFGIDEQEQEEQFTQDNLTPREKEIVECLTKGLDDKGIADCFFIAPGTVKKHRQNIAKKWGVSEDLQVLKIEAKSRGYDKGR